MIQPSSLCILRGRSLAWQERLPASPLSTNHLCHHYHPAVFHLRCPCTSPCHRMTRVFTTINLKENACLVRARALLAAPEQRPQPQILSEPTSARRAETRGATRVQAHALRAAPKRTRMAVHGSDFHIMPACGRNGNAFDESGGPRGYPAMIFSPCPSMPPEYLEEHSRSYKPRLPLPLSWAQRHQDRLWPRPVDSSGQGLNSLMNPPYSVLPRDKRVRVAQSGKHMFVSLATSQRMCPHLCSGFQVPWKRHQENFSPLRARRRVRNTGHALSSGDETVQ